MQTVESPILSLPPSSIGQSSPGHLVTGGMLPENGVAMLQQAQSKHTHFLGRNSQIYAMFVVYGLNQLMVMKLK